MHALPPTSSQVISPRYCYVRTELSPKGTLHVACAGREPCKPSYLVERGQFPCYGLEFVADGGGQVVLDGQSFPLSPGVVFSYGPHTRHRISNSTQKPMTKYFVDFFGEEAETLLSQGSLRPGGAVQVFEVEPLRVLFDHLISAGSGDSVAADALCSAYLRVILLRAAQGIAPSQRGSPATERLFHRCLEHIEKHYTRLRDLHDLAAALNTQPARLCRVFKQQGHPGPFALLTRKKMHFAAELLAADRMSVQEAAEKVGYADPYHFSRLFKRHFGRSPRDFRNQFQRCR